MKIRVLVKAGSSKGPLVEAQADGSLIIFVREAAVEGKANVAVTKLVAKHYGVAKSCVEITRGHTSSHKTVDVETGN